MQGIYDYCPAYRLYTILEKELIMNKHDNYKKIDDILRLILLNNGCEITKKLNDQATYEITNDYQICFIRGMLGNKVNTYYDFLIFNGIKILVIFLDYFEHINGTDSYNNDTVISDIIGRSIYYDAIKKIVEVFYLTFEPVIVAPTTTVATIRRWNQVIIAIHILNKGKPVNENDIPDVSTDDITKILSENIQLQLYGIRISKL